AFERHKSRHWIKSDHWIRCRLAHDLRGSGTYDVPRIAAGLPVPRAVELTPARWLHVRARRRDHETVAAAAGDWLARYATTARNAKGQHLAATRVRLYLLPALGARRLDSLTGDDVRAYRVELERVGLAPNTVLHVLSDLRALLGWAVSEGRLWRSPFPR